MKAEDQGKPGLQIFYAKDKHVIIYFHKTHLRHALSTLKGMAKFFQAAWICTAAEELEEDLQTPKLLTYDVSRFHICEHCATEIDTKSDPNGYIHRTAGGVDRWVHLQCPVLKPNRPV